MALRPLLSAKAVVLASVLYVAIATPLTGGLAAWVEETGAIESLGFLLMLLAPVAFFAHFPVNRWLPLLHVPVMTFLLAKREAESDWWIIDERLLSTSFYVEQGLSLTALIGAMIAAIVLLSVLTFLRYGLISLWRGFRHGAHWAYLLTVGFILAVGGQVLEELAIPLVQSGLTEWLVIVLEEGSEMIFSLMVVLAILAVPQQGAAISEAGEQKHGRAAPDGSFRSDRLDGTGAAGPVQHPGGGS